MKMVKLVMFFVVITILASTGFSATVSVPDTKASPSSTVQVPLEIDNASGIAGFQMTIVFDQDVLTAQQALTGTLTDDWLLFYNVETPGVISIAGLNPDLDELPDIDGSLVFISFFVEGAVGETTNITITQTGFYNSLAENITVFCQSGLFTIDVNLGDINGDDTIDISDVILCLRMAIELPVNVNAQNYSSPYPLWLKSRADMNSDTEINISDVILILRKAIGLD